MLTEKQQRLIKRVKDELKDEPWFKGVCLDNLPEDLDIDRDGEEPWVTQLIMDTFYWDSDILP
jgi:hypothetical protein